MTKEYSQKHDFYSNNFFTKMCLKLMYLITFALYLGPEFNGLTFLYSNSFAYFTIKNQWLLKDFYLDKANNGNIITTCEICLCYVISVVLLPLLLTSKRLFHHVFGFHKAKFGSLRLDSLTHSILVTAFFAYFTRKLPGAS